MRWDRSETQDRNENRLFHHGYLDRTAPWFSLAIAQCAVASLRNKSGLVGGWEWQQGLVAASVRGPFPLGRGCGEEGRPNPWGSNYQKIKIRNLWASTQHNNGRKSPHIIQYHVMKSNLFFQWVLDSPIHPRWWLGSVPSDGVWRESASKWQAPPRKPNCSLKWSRQCGNEREEEQCPYTSKLYKGCECIPHYIQRTTSSPMKKDVIWLFPNSSIFLST